MTNIDNTKALQSFKDATANSIAKLSGAAAMKQIKGLSTKLNASTILGSKKTKIQTDIFIFRDLVILYVDTMSDNHDYKTKYPMSVTPGYQEVLTDFGSGKYQFPPNGRPYYNILHTGMSLFDDAAAGIVNAIFTADNCTPITNFSNSNTDTKKPSIAFMDNFSIIYKAIDDEITVKPKPPPEPPASEAITAAQVAALKAALDQQNAADQGLENKIVSTTDCTNEFPILSGVMSYLRGLSSLMNLACKGGPTTDCINNQSKTLYATFQQTFAQTTKVVAPNPLYYTPTGLSTGSDYKDYSTIIASIGQICTGLPPGPPSDEPSDELWNALAAKMTTLKASFDTKRFQTPYQPKCKHPGAQDYITYFDSFIPVVLQDINQHSAKNISGVNSAMAGTYKYGIGSVPAVTGLPIPKSFVLTYSKGLSDIEITPSISDYTKFYTETLYNFCAEIQNYNDLLQVQEDCFTADSAKLKKIIDDIANPGDIKTCRSPSDTTNCITVGNKLTTLAQAEATALKKYVDLLGLKFTALLTVAQKTKPITLKAAQDLVTAFNTYSTSSFTKIPGLDYFEAVQLSTPASMTTPISGCLWGPLSTTIGKVVDTFNQGVTPCTLSLRCADLSIKPSGTFPAPGVNIFTTFDKIFEYACTAADPCPKGNVILLCLLTTDLRYMTGGNVWSGSIKGILDKLTNADSTGFFDYCQGETPADSSKLNTSYRGLIQQGYITTVPIDIPNVDKEIAAVNSAATDMILDNEYNAYSSYFNNMRVWLKFYFGPDVGTFLVNALQTNYLDWYNQWHPDPSKMVPDDFKTITDFLWSPEQLKDDGALDKQATTLLDFMTDSEYKSFMAQVETALAYNTTINMGKYTLAIGLEYAVTASDSDETTKIMNVLNKLPAIMPKISYVIAQVAVVKKEIATEFFKLLKDATYGPTFTKVLNAAIVKLLASDSTFTKDLADIKDFLEKKEGGYNILVDGINTKYPGIKKCSDGDTTHCGSNFPGGQASIWQDTGSMWSHFPSPDLLVPVDSQLSGAAPTVESLFGPWFNARGQQGVFNYHLSFAQLDVVGDILSGKERQVDDTTLNDTLLPYVISYKTAMSSGTQKDALEGFLKDLKASLKKNTNNKGNLGLSFGGENATLADNVLSDTESAPSLFYNTILKNVDSVDFDMENAGFTADESKASCSDQCSDGGTCTNQCKFFKTIRGLITSDYGAIQTSCLLDATSTGCDQYSTQPKMYLTLLGNPATSTKLNMGPLMSNSVEYFDGVNLMLYDNGTGYYITANSGTAWSLQKWAEAIDLKTDSSESIQDTFVKLSPCYQDLTPYYDPAADKGEKVNWALTAETEINKIYGPSDFTGSFLQSLDVGSAAWVINRQFWQDSLSSYPKVAQADIKKFLNAKASAVSWWPDNNLHGSLCTSGASDCNQYGVQQAFSACQILWNLGYNPFTFELFALPDLYQEIEALVTTIDSKDSSLQALTKKALADEPTACTALTGMQASSTAIKTYVDDLSTLIKSKLTSADSIDTIVSAINANQPSATGFPSGLTAMEFVYDKSNAVITATPGPDDYTTAMDTLTASVDAKVKTCDPGAAPKIRHEGVLETWWNTNNGKGLSGNSSAGGEIDLFFKALGDSGVNYLNVFIGGSDLFKFTFPADIMSLATSHGLLLKVCIGGAISSPNLTNFGVETADNWITALESLDKIGFKGLDLDLEQAVDFDRLQCVTQKLYAETKSGGKLEDWDFTWTLRGGVASQQSVQGMNLANLAALSPKGDSPAYHRLNIMMYDISQPSWKKMGLNVWHIAGYKTGWENFKYPEYIGIATAFAGNQDASGHTPTPCGAVDDGADKPELLPFYSCTQATSGAMWISEQMCAGCKGYNNDKAVPDVTKAPYNTLGDSLCFIRQNLQTNGAAGACPCKPPSAVPTEKSAFKACGLE